MFSHRLPLFGPGAIVAAGWQMRTTGWAWWLVFLLAVAGVWGLVRLHRLELGGMAPGVRRRLLWLRGSALALLVLFLMEPSLSRRTSERILPLVAVVIDQSGSMGIQDESMSPGAKLAEAAGLGLLPAGARPLQTNAAAQAASDLAVASRASKDSEVGKSLAFVSNLSRYQRAVAVAQKRIIPALDGKARVKVFALDSRLLPLDLSKPGSPGAELTDFSAGLATLARDWAQDYVGGVMLVSDGRQTAGEDPVPVIRSLRARGALLAGIVVGDPAAPPDAVVAEISGSGEVFQGETVPLSVRYRITGLGDSDWDLVLTREGKEIERRTVRGNGQWQYEHFAFPATNAGINLFQARLELAREQSSEWLLKPAGALTLEQWNNIGGERVSDLVDNGGYNNPPSATAILSQLEYANRGAQYGTRIRGFLIPPQSGNYTFWIGSDDGSELWLSPTDDPQEKRKIASVAGYVARGRWDQPSQKSRPITLAARRPYYFEVLHKQGSGEDYLTAGWQLPDGSLERPIPGSRVAPYDRQTLTALAERRQQATLARTNQWKEASLANNAADFPVVVNQDPIKVLLVDSTPRWESRYLAAMFERDRRVNLTRRYHSVILQEPGLTLLPRTQAEWNGYDMVCLGDLDANELPPDQQQAIAEFVSRRGGFLVCLAGPRGLPRAFSLGTLADLLPVRVSLSSSRDVEPATVALTPAGADSPVMQVLNDPTYNQRLWPLLPPLQWLADPVVAKPGATVLLAAQNAAKTPVVAAQRYGAGRVFWMGTEESWRWRDRLGDRVHQTFWLQVMRWGLAGRLRGKDPRLQVGLDRYLVRPGETAELKARVALADGAPAGEPPVVKMEKLGENGEALPALTRQAPMLPMAGAPGIWRLPLEGLDEGVWHITVSSRALEANGVRETRPLMVRAGTGAEGFELGSDPGNLSRMANAGGHRAGTMDQADALANDFASKLKPRTEEHRETIALWNSYISIALVIALLCCEWVLRKRQGLP